MAGFPAKRDEQFFAFLLRGEESVFVRRICGTQVEVLGRESGDRRDLILVLREVDRVVRVVEQV